MKIGIDARLWNETGVGRYIRALVDTLQEIDDCNEYVVFLRQPEFHTVKLTNSKWIKKLADVSWHSMEEQIKMPGIYDQAGIDLIHIPYFSVPLFIKKPFIVTIHDLTISHFATGKATTKPLPVYFFKRLIYSLILKHAVNRSKFIITVSNYVKDQIISEFGINSDKIAVTYESGKLTDDTYFENKFNIPKEYVLYVGNAHPHKNLERLLHAFKLIYKKHPKLKLVFFGKSNYFYEQLKKNVVKLNLSLQVIFIDNANDIELVHWYKNAKYFIFPSLSEGFGLPGLEAMSVGCPILVSNIPVFKEIYADAAEYFDPYSIDDMASKMDYLLHNNQVLQNLKESGKLQYQKYSWRKMSFQTMKIYENSIGI